jgi:hypothetical protein
MAHDWSNAFDGDEIVTCARCGLRVRYAVEIRTHAAGAAPHPRALQLFMHSGSKVWEPSSSGRGRSLPKCSTKGGA